MKKQCRRYDEEFKSDLVAQIDGGNLTKAQAARENGVAPNLIDR